MRRDYRSATTRRGRSFFASVGNSFLGLIMQRPKASLITILLLFVVLPFVTVAWLARDLPTPNSITQDARYSTTLLDRKGKVIYQVFENKNIIPVPFSEIPKDVIHATIAIEDKNFYTHGGFSVVSIIRAAIRNLIFKKAEGGSTLTQQLIKNTLLTPEKTYIRKLKEFLLAVEVERRFTKDEILQMYLNQTPYGGTSWGIESAAQTYFDKHAKDLTLIESAILAGFPQSPSIYSPFIGKKDAYIERTKQVLRRMREDKYITKDQEKELLAKLPHVHFSSNKNTIPAAHFVFYIKSILDSIFSDDTLYRKGLIIKTTLDLDLQREAEKIVKDEVKKAKGLDISNGAVVAIDPKTGEIRAYVGSADYSNDEFGKFDAARGLRQPGSALKPFTYAVALEKQYTAASVFMDVPTEFATGKEQLPLKPYNPQNYDGKFRGPIQMRFALGSSLNVPAVKAVALTGVETFLQKAYDAGLKTLEPTQSNLNRFGFSISLGGGEVRLLDLTTAYSVFANKGETVEPVAITEVRDYRNKLLYKPKKAEHKKVFGTDIVFLISHILSDNNARLLTFGANNYMSIPGKTVAAKTGTTDDKRDNWTVGYSNGLVVGVWVGNNDNSKMSPSLASGLSGAAPIWSRVFQYAFKKGYKDGIIEKPKNVEAFEIDAFFEGAPYNDSPRRSEYFIKGTEPKTTSPFYKKLKISKSTGKRANALEIAAGNYEEKDFYVVIEQDPISQDGKNRWLEGILKWGQEQKDDKWKVPSETSDTNADDVAVTINKPSNMQKLTSNDIDILAKAVSMQSLKSFKFFVNNELKKETTNMVIDEKINLPDGVYELKFVAVNSKDKTAESTIRIGVNQDPTPTATPTPAPTETPPTPTLTPPEAPPEL